MDKQLKPIYLLSDSQILFWEKEHNNFIASIRKSLEVNKRNVTKAAYIGAANGDNPEFYELFLAAMDNINLHESRMICSDFSEKDRAFLEKAELILVAGGDYSKGWAEMESNGIGEIIIEKYYSGSVLIGVSAGAILLGMGKLNQDKDEIQKALRLFPYYIDVYDESHDWKDLKDIVVRDDMYCKAYGIPSGSGLIYYGDFTIEPLRRPAIEICKEKDSGKIINNILMPDECIRQVESKEQ